MKAFTIGSDSSCDLVVRDKTVSGVHCQLKKLEDGIVAITDLDSSNGTFVDGRRIRRTVFLDSAQLILGDKIVDSADLMKSITAHHKEHKSDFKAEYQDLMNRFKEFQVKKDRILEKPKTALYARVGIIIVLIILFLFNRDEGKFFYILFIASAALITIVSGFFNRSPVKKNEDMDKLLLEYEDILVCPKCSSSMLNHGYSYWIGKTTCNNGKCDAEFQ